jgi:hypothetical protein
VNVYALFNDFAAAAHGLGYEGKQISGIRIYTGVEKIMKNNVIVCAV